MARVALVCEPPDGGVAEHVARLALELPPHGHDAVVFASADFQPAAELLAAGREVRTVPFGRDYAHPHRDAAVLVALVSALRRGRFDVVHAHAAKAGVLARVAARLAGRPSAYTPHCFPFVGDVSLARRRLGAAAERALAPATWTIVCVCEQERSLARAHGLRPRGSLAVVHNGCPPCPSDVAPDAELAALRRDGPVVGAVTVLRRQKALGVLLDATPRVLDAVPEARFAIVGNGPELPALHAHAQRLGAAAQDRLRFLPFEAPAARYLRALDLFVLPSAWEALPIGVLEAQACGVPQIAARVGGLPEVVTPQTGTLVPSGDPAALADAIVALLRDPARRRAMAAASRARHAEHFSAERMAAATGAVYDDLLRTGAAHRRRR